MYRARHLFAAVSFAVTGALAVAVTFSTPGTGDYRPAGPAAGDNPAPAIDALAHGHLAAAAGHQPLMGLVSLVLRAPTALAPGATGYRLGALICLLGIVLAFAWQARVTPATPTARGMLFLSALLVLAGPLTRQALSAGHPEELLAGALVIGATLVAGARRPAPAGILLGLAVGTKQWAVVGIGPVLTALPAGRVRAGVWALSAAALSSLPLPLADPHAFAAATRSVGTTHFVNPLSAWWPASIASRTDVVRILPFGLSRSVASLLVLAPVAAVAAWLSTRNRSSRSTVHPMAQLTLLLLARGLLDPLPIEYYLAPAIVAAAAWECGRPPILTATLTAAIALAFGPGQHLAPGVLNALVIAGSLGLAAWIAATGGLTTDGNPRRVGSSSMSAPEPPIGIS